jgi:peptide/nickel transport system substrate-binding protein
VVVACAPAAGPTTDRSPAVPQEAKPTALHIGLWTPLTLFGPRMVGARGAEVMNAGLVATDERWAIKPYLAERIPSQDGGTWLIRPDGTMQTTWTLRPDARWHDGTPVTAHDVVFAHRVYRDKDFQIDTDLPERYITGVVPRDDRTFDVSWDRPYVQAGQPDPRDLTPLPRHVLEPLYEGGDKTVFSNHSFWRSEEYIGAGPYRVVRNDPGVMVRVAANPDFFLGKPRIDTIDFIMIPDRNALVARMLSGDLDYTEHTDIQAEHAAVLQDQWRMTGEGRILTAPWTPFPLRFQYKDVPNHTTAMKDIRVRQALVHTIDRDALAASETAGLAPAADSFVPPNQELFPRVDAAIVKYPYDTRRAAQLLQEAGWTRAADGILRSVRGEAFDIEVFSTTAAARGGTIVADYWKQAGMDSRLFALTPAQVDDFRLRANYPGVDVSSRGQGEGELYASYSTPEIASDANQWRGRNVTGWSDPEFDALFARYDRSLRPAERADLLVEMERQMSVTLASGKLYYAARPAAIRNVVQGPRGFNTRSSNLFNIHEWAVQ